MRSPRSSRPAATDNSDQTKRKGARRLFPVGHALVSSRMSRMTSLMTGSVPIASLTLETVMASGSM